MFLIKRFCAVGLFSLLLSGSAIAQPNQSPDDPLAVNTQKLSALLYYVDHSYVDSVNLNKIVDDGIRKMMEDLDPHSVYIPKKDVERMSEPLRGDFEGIGIQFDILHDTILVVQTISGGPSEKLGIQAGDKIVSIDGKNVAGTGITNMDVINSLRGPKGTKVDVGILRQGDKKPLKFEITRDKIPLNSVDASYMAEPGVGYIKISRFAANTLDEFDTSLTALKRKGMKDLILDLQDNGGGYLRTAIGIADEFLDDHKLIVYTQGRVYPRSNTYATSKGNFQKGHLIVLINENSASASEIVTGALQDWDRALVVGRRSFGKGLVQRPIMLPDSSMIRLTIEKYYTPSGRCIQKPYNHGLKAYEMDAYNRLEHGELMHKDSIHFNDSLKYYTHNHRLVYGGGGIMPDVFVPLDTSYSSQYNSDLIRKGVFNNFTISYVNEHRKELHKQYPTVEDYIKNFKIDDDFMKKFFDFADKQKVPFVKDEYEQSAPMIKVRLKAQIALNLWNSSASYQVFNKMIPAYDKALQLIKSNAAFDKYLDGTSQAQPNGK